MLSRRLTAVFAILATALITVPFTVAQDATAIDRTGPHPAVAPAVEEIDQVVAAGPFKADWKSLEGYEIPQWYKDAKFGIFIHWGAYSVPAFGSEWYPRQMYIDRARRGDNFFQHHKEKWGSQKEFGYKDFIPQFKAENFDATRWAKLFKDTGARYVIPVAEHHDGFPMYESDFTRWDSTEMGPKRDIVKELANAVRAEGMKFGVSSHRAFNWMFYVRSEDFDNVDPQYADLYGRAMPFLYGDEAWNYQNNFPPQDDQFKDDWLARSCELVDKYQPDVFWFDFGIAPNRKATYDQNHFAEHLKRFSAYYYNQSEKWDKGIGIINYKWSAYPEGAAVLDKERSKMAEIRKPFWQTDTAVSASSWGYTQNQKYKTADRLVDDLVDIVSKNGCLLLNVGPRPDGTIPEEDKAILKGIGSWLKINGEAIYDTTYWKTFGEGPTGVSTGHVAEKNDKRFTSEDLRFTVKDESLYVTGLKWPESGSVTVKSLATGSAHYPEQIASVVMLGSKEKLKWSRGNDGLTVELPKAHPSEYAYVLKVSAGELPPNVAPSQAYWYHRYKTQKNVPDPAEMLLNTDEEPELTEGFTDLFNGRDLTGWKPYGGTCKFEVENGMIKGTCVRGSESTYLSTERSDFKDFVFTCDVKWLVDGNTGVMFRSKSRPRDKKKPDSNVNRTVFGPQVELEGFAGFAKGRFWSGGIYGQSCGGYFYPLWLEDHVPTRSALKQEGWNRVTISAKGNEVKTWVNGVPMANWTDDGSYSDGFFGLQIHKGPQGTVLFKNIRVKE